MNTRIVIVSVLLVLVAVFYKPAEEQAAGVGTKENLMLTAMAVSETDPVTENISPEALSTKEAAKRQKKADSEAKKYLRYLPFSRRGLIEQLRFDGFSYDEAARAVDKLEADWTEQAMKKAEMYRERTVLTDQQIYRQLLYMGFSKDEASFGSGLTTRKL